MWNNHKYVIWKPWATFPLLYLEIRLGEVSERLWTLEPWQSTKDRCQAVIPGNKWHYICHLFDSEWSLGKYELSLLGLSSVCQPCNLFCCFVSASLHTLRQAELIDCHIAVKQSQLLSTITAVAKEQHCLSNTTNIWLAVAFHDLYSMQRILLLALFPGPSHREVREHICTVSVKEHLDWYSHC